jgi:hypothetical protein
MRYIDLSLIDINDSKVIHWRRRALKFTNKLNTLQKHDERVALLKAHPIWNTFKSILFSYYGHKCWYSECDITGSYGDVDHFCPKSCSTDENGCVILQGGYWWLAYDYINYRLSCEVCNRPYKKGGKGNSFPLQTSPSNFTRSSIPLLLDPCVKRDTQLIDMDIDGSIIPMTRNVSSIRRIQFSIKTYNLNCFNKAREKVRNRCINALGMFEDYYENLNNKLERPLTQIKDLTDEQTPYSSFAIKYFRREIKNKPYENVFKIFPWY